MTPILIDFETLSQNPANGIAISFSAVPLDITKTFKELQELAFNVKLNIEDQQRHGKKTMKSTMGWWSTLPKEILAKSMPKEGEGLTINEFCEFFDAWCNKLEPNKFNRLLVCRGCSFDIQFLNSFYRIYHETDDVMELTPQKFWNEMDVRSFVKGLMMSIDNVKIPISADLLDGFEQHNPLHDVAKDVILIQQAMEYAAGKELPTNNVIMV